MRRTFIDILILIIVVSASYSNSFHAPFEFDDRTSIEKNVLIRDLDNFISYDAGDGIITTMVKKCPPRYVGLLTFALNYHFNGLDVTGYHIINFIIHLLNSILVYLFVMLTFRTPVMSEYSISAVRIRMIALFSSLLFASHPVQTQAVTYIVQRFASLAALFYILSLVLYIKSRISGSATPRSIFFALSLLSAVLAMKTKENSFTLPLVIGLYEGIFFKSEIKQKIRYLAPFALTFFIIPLNMLSIDKPVGEIISDVSDRAMVQADTSRFEYMITQVRVIVTYLRLLILPVNQNLDYDYPLYSTLFNMEIIASLILLLALAGAAFFMMRMKNSDHVLFRLISFGIFWFFITLSVESSIIPIADVIFEHRLYLPSIGICMSFVLACSIISSRAQNRWQRAGKFMVIIGSIVIAALSIVTYNRNVLWTDSIDLWSDVVKKSPNKSRGYNNLAEGYIKAQRKEEAFQCLQKALELDPKSPTAHTNMGVHYSSIGDNQKAWFHYEEAVRLMPDSSEAHLNLGFTYLTISELDLAIKHMERSADLDPTNARLHLNLSIVYRKKGMPDKAMKHREIARSLEPSLFNMPK